MKNELKKQLFDLVKGTALIHNFSQRDLAKVLNVSQPRVSNLLSGRLDLFTLDTLIDFADSLGYYVEIKTTTKDNQS